MSYMPYTSNIPDPASSICIIGSSYSGVGLAHKLLKHGIPDSYEVVIVGPSSSLYWNIAAPRALSKNNAFGKQNIDLFKEFVPEFAEYAEKKKFRFVQGFVTEIRIHSSTIVIQQAHELESDQQPLGIMEFPYDHIVFAMGASYFSDWPFKSLGTRAKTEKALREKRKRIEAANIILISGAGPTGVEITGEIVTAYPEKKVILLTSDTIILPKFREDVRDAAIEQLKSLGATIWTRAKAVSERLENGRTIVTLTSGDNVEVDLHIPAWGLVPNTSFVPEDMLDVEGWVKVTETLNVPNYTNFWAVGDVAGGVQHRQFDLIRDMVQVVKNNMILRLLGYSDLAMTVFRERQTPLMITIGNKFGNGTGLFGDWKPWGSLVWMLKGLYYRIKEFDAIAEGQKLPGGKGI